MTMADIYIYIYWYVEFYGIWLAICIWEMMYGKKIDLKSEPVIFCDKMWFDAFVSFIRFINIWWVIYDDLLWI
jgi:hypothetical protein